MYPLDPRSRARSKAGNAGHAHDRMRSSKGQCHVEAAAGVLSAEFDEDARQGDGPRLSDSWRLRDGSMVPRLLSKTFHGILVKTKSISIFDTMMRDNLERRLIKGHFCVYSSDRGGSGRERVAKASDGDVKNDLCGK